jgi:hypothetical protein
VLTTPFAEITARLVERIENKTDARKHKPKPSGPRSSGPKRSEETSSRKA